MALSPTSSRSSGGSAAPTTRAVYTGFASCADGANTSLAWTSKDSGDALLNIATVPTLPTIVATGVYAVAAKIGPGATMTAGGAFKGRLELDVDGDAVYVEATADTTPNLDPQVALTLVYYLAAGAEIRVVVDNEDGVATRVFNFNATVQRIA